MKHINIGYSAHLDYLNYLPSRVEFETEFTEPVTVSLLPIATHSETSYMDFYFSTNKIKQSTYDLLLHPTDRFKHTAAFPGVYNLPIINKLESAIAIQRLALAHPEIKLKPLHFFQPLFNSDASIRKTNIGEIDEIKAMMEIGKEFIIKPIWGARSFGISVLPKEVVDNWVDINRLFAEDHALGLQKLIDYNVNIPDIKHFEEGGFIIQEKADIVAEYRILKVWDKYYSMERETRELGQPLGKISDYKPLEQEENLGQLYDDVIKVIELLGKDIPVGSFDLFVTEYDQIGFFEYNAQFAIDKMDSSVRQQICRDIVLGYLKDNLKLLQLKMNSARPIPPHRVLAVVLNERADDVDKPRAKHVMGANGELVDLPSRSD